MNSMLDKIVKQKQTEIDKKKKQLPKEALRDQYYYTRKCLSLKETLQQATKPAIIAEHKRKSPSKGIINDRFPVDTITSGYYRAGASAISVLTDNQFFAGTESDLISTRKLQIPILRKDFIIDPYQIHEAKGIGADVILLIAAILDTPAIEKLSALAHELGMEVLFEIHDEAEAEKIITGLDIIGVNNRNLNDFSVDPERSKALKAFIPKNTPAISESGLFDATVILDLFNAGYKGFLIGESFMREEDPPQACRKLIQKLDRP